MADCTDLVLRRDWIRATWWAIPCQLHPNRPQANGYVKVMIKTVMMEAHRHAWFATFGPPPPNNPWVLHACDVRNCWEIRHLWNGTPEDNARDREAKGRGWGRRQTHCSTCGLALSGPNLYVTPSGYRNCRACRKRQAREMEQRRPYRPGKGGGGPRV